MNTTYLGLDPGLKGGLACLGPKGLHVVAMPVIKGVKGGTKATLDAGRIVTLLTDWRDEALSAQTMVLATVEKVGSMPKQGIASAFKFGMGYGQLQGILVALGIPMQLATPQAWKKSVLGGTKKDKAAAIHYVQLRYPDVSLLPTERSKVDSDGMADAICLAEHGKRLNS